MQSYPSSSALAPPGRAYRLKLGALGVLLAGTVVAAAIGAVGSLSAPVFYLSLNRPSWAPPPAVFGPAWTVLYMLMAIAAWIVVRVQGWDRAKPALALYAVQLAANALWTWLFFHWHLGGAAFGESIVLWLLVAATIAAFARVHRLAGVLLLPYIAWVSFATALTWAVWRANPGRL